MGEKEKTHLTYFSSFPNSKHDPIEICSPETEAYNCIAWALGENFRWWEPESEGCFWLESLEKGKALTTVVRLFKEAGFKDCKDVLPERGYEKVALFSADGLTCEHVSRQLSTGIWTSKLGLSFDVNHTLHSLEGGIYGYAVLFLKRVLK